MKEIIIIILAVIIVSVLACDKEPDITDNKKVLKFESLLSNDTLIPVNEFTTITATASGDELEFIWDYEAGAIVGSGSQVMWSNCCVDTQTINCTVRDKYNQTESKSIKIYVY